MTDQSHSSHSRTWRVQFHDSFIDVPSTREQQQAVRLSDVAIPLLTAELGTTAISTTGADVGGTNSPHFLSATAQTAVHLGFESGYIALEDSQTHQVIATLPDDLLGNYAETNSINDGSDDNDNNGAQRRFNLLVEEGSLIQQWHFILVQHQEAVRKTEEDENEENDDDEEPPVVPNSPSYDSQITGTLPLPPYGTLRSRHASSHSRRQKSDLVQTCHRYGPQLYPFGVYDPFLAAASRVPSSTATATNASAGSTCTKYSDKSLMSSEEAVSRLTSLTDTKPHTEDPSLDFVTRRWASDGNGGRPLYSAPHDQYGLPSTIRTIGSSLMLSSDPDTKKNKDDSRTAPKRPREDGADKLEKGLRDIRSSKLSIGLALRLNLKNSDGSQTELVDAPQDESAWDKMEHFSRGGLRGDIQDGGRYAQPLSPSTAGQDPRTNYIQL